MHAEPYLVKLRFQEPIVEGGPNFSFKATEDSYIIRVGKLNYKQQFNNLDQPESLILDIDEELKDQLQYEEETKDSAAYEYGLNQDLTQQIPSEITSFAGCCDPIKVQPGDRLMVKL